LANRDQIPVIFLACANSYREGMRLNYLVRERRRIANILSVEEDKGHLEIVQEGNTSKEFFFDELRQRKYKGRIAIIHFAGHADNGVLRFESEEGQEESMNIDTLATFLGTISGLHLVFLNGCGTKPIVEKLLQKGIPVVLATQTSVEDRQAAKVAEEFYQGIAGGYSIKESFEQAKAISREAFSYYEVDESGDIIRGLEWDGMDPKESHTAASFPWGLYIRKGEESHLEWRLETQKDSHKIAHPNPWYKRADVWLGMAALVASIIFGILELNVNDKAAKNIDVDKGETEQPAIPDDPVSDDPTPPDLPPLQERIDQLAEQPNFFGRNREETYNILLIPFINLKDRERTLNGFIERRLREISDISQLPLNVQVRELDSTFHNAEEQLTPRDARRLGQKYFADMVVWGSYLFDIEEADEIKMDVVTEPPLNRYDEVALNREIQTRNRRRGYRTLPYPDFSRQDSTLQDVEAIVFWARGNELLEQNAYEKALDYYENINGNFATVNLQFAHVYANLADMKPGNKNTYYRQMADYIQQIFDPADSSLPKNARILYYIGLLYDQYGKGDFQTDDASRTREALNYYSLSLEQDPEFIQSYFRRGRLYHYKLREYNKALEDYNAYIERDSTFPYVFHDRGKLYHYALNDSIDDAVYKALSDYNQIIQLAPQYAWAYEDRGRLYQTYLNQPQQAKADFDKAIELSSLAYSYFYRGLINQEAKNYEDALRDYNMALKQNNQLSNTYFYRNKIYDQDLISQPVTVNEMDEEDKKSVYARLAEIYEKVPKDSLLFYKNARISIRRGEQIQPRYIERMRRAGRLQQ